MIDLSFDRNWWRPVAGVGLAVRSSFRGCESQVQIQIILPDHQSSFYKVFQVFLDFCCRRRMMTVRIDLPVELRDAASAIA